MASRLSKNSSSPAAALNPKTWVSLLRLTVLGVFKTSSAAADKSSKLKA